VDLRSKPPLCSIGAHRVSLVYVGGGPECGAEAARAGQPEVALTQLGVKIAIEALRTLCNGLGRMLLASSGTPTEVAALSIALAEPRRAFESSATQNFSCIKFLSCAASW